MSRAAIALAIVTGVAPGVWVEEGWQTIQTAYDLLEKANSKDSGEGPPMRG